MKIKYKVFMLVIGIFATLCLILGASYALYVYNISQRGSNVISSDDFQMSFNESNDINIQNGVPLGDDEVMDLTPYTFTVENLSDHAMNYNINIETLNTSTIDLDAVDLKLNGTVIKGLGSIPNNDSSVIINKTIASSSKTIYSGLLSPGEEKTFELRLWVDEDSTIEQSANKTFASKVVATTSLLPEYKEATLISGPLFNKTLKQLAGDEPTQSNINSYNNLITGANYDASKYPSDFNVYNYLVSDYSIVNFAFANQEPSAGDNAVVVSTNDSDVEVLAWFDTDTIYLYSSADRIYLNPNSAYLFDRLSGMENVDLSHFDTSKATDMQSMFWGVVKVRSYDLSNFDTSNVTNMGNMFYANSVLASLDVSNFNTSKVTDMQWMFGEDCTLASLDLRSFDTSKVTNMTYMFSSMSALNDLNISTWNTSSVTNMSHMFTSCSSLRQIDVSSFNTSNVTDMSYMFSNIYNMPVLDISSFDTRNATNMNYMFGSLQSAQTIYVGDNWSTTQIGSSGYISASAWTLVGGQGTKVRDGFNGDYQRIDCPPDSPGYLTYKGTLGDTAAYCASLSN